MTWRSVPNKQTNKQSARTRLSGTNKLIQQGCEVQNKHKNKLYLYVLYLYVDTKIKIIPFTIKKKKPMELYKYKSNKTYEGLVCWKLQKTGKKLKEDLNKWGGIPCSWVGRFPKWCTGLM